MRNVVISTSLLVLLSACAQQPSNMLDPCERYGFCPDQIQDPGTGPWTLVEPTKVGETCALDYEALEAANVPEGASFAVIRYGKMCYVSGEDDMAVGSDVSHVFSVSKTLGASLVGMTMYDSRYLADSSQKMRGPLKEFDRADKWLNMDQLPDRTDIHPDATIAHILSMEAYNDSLAYGDKRHRYDAAGTREINQLIKVIDNVVAQDPEGLGANALAVRDRLFAKLGFEHSTWPGQVFGYSWNTSMFDMGRLGLMILNGGIYNKERVMDAQYVYNMTHPAFEDGSTRYGYLTWMAPLDCAPISIHQKYPHGISKATSCELDSGCEQQYDVGVWSANGARGQFIIGHRALDLVIVGKNWQQTGANLLWNEVRPAVINADPVYKGDEDAFCKAYGAGDYAPELKKWEGNL